MTRSPVLTAGVVQLASTMRADPEKIIEEGGHWTTTIVAETEEEPGVKSQVVIAKLKVEGLLKSQYLLQGVLQRPEWQQMLNTVAPQPICSSPAVMNAWNEDLPWQHPAQASECPGLMRQLSLSDGSPPALDTQSIVQAPADCFSR